MPRPRRLPQGSRTKNTRTTSKHTASSKARDAKTPTQNRPNAARANLVKARAALKSLPPTPAQSAASRANLAASRAHVKAAPSAAQKAVQAAWVAKGEHAWLVTGEAAWIARGRAAWLRHRNTGGVVRLHSLKASVGLKHPIGTHIAVSPLKRSFARPHLLYQPHRFFKELMPTSSPNVATVSSWHRGRKSNFRKHITQRKMRRHYIGHWRRTRKRVHPY